MPSKIQFCVFEKAHDEPSGSGYCQKLETFFRASDFRDYEVKFTSVFTAPKGKLPYIIINGKPIADSHFIVQYLIREGRIRDIEELVYPATVWTRFAYPENWEILKVEVFKEVPNPIRWLLSWFIRRRVANGLKGHGVGRHSREEVDSILQDFVQNLIIRLKESKGPYFHGDKVAIIDCVVYGFMANALRMKSNPGYSALILESDVLREYVARGTRLWFPEYTRILEMVEDGSTGPVRK